MTTPAGSPVAEVAAAAAERVAAFCLMRPQPSKGEALLQALAPLVAAAQHEQGCLVYDLYLEADASVVLHEVWRSAADFAVHVQQPAMTAFYGDEIDHLIIGTMEVHQATPL